jgi:predicted nuclease with RNAse H fold
MPRSSPAPSAVTPRPSRALLARVKRLVGFDNASRRFPVVVGIDVGGPGKGFHLVALRDRQICHVAKLATPAEVAACCAALEAEVIAIDAPSGWSRASGTREAEAKLQARGISCFRTPQRAAALGRPFFAWVFNGEALFAALAPAFAHFDGRSYARGRPVCFETYPFAAATSLAGRKLRAADKDADRRLLLRAAGVDLTPLRGIDTVDAALCALVACAYVAGRHTAVGNCDEGFIVWPNAD